jgi:hypothetical protein
VPADDRSERRVERRDIQGPAQPHRERDVVGDVAVGSGESVDEPQSLLERGGRHLGAGGTAPNRLGPARLATHAAQEREAAGIH